MRNLLVFYFIEKYEIVYNLLSYAVYFLKYLKG